jgi:hypothetical protein
MGRRKGLRGRGRRRCSRSLATERVHHRGGVGDGGFVKLAGARDGGLAEFVAVGRRVSAEGLLVVLGVAHGALSSSRVVYSTTPR